MTKEKTILAFQCEGIRLQLIVKNNKVYLIKNRRKVEIDYQYNENWNLNEKITKEFKEIINNYILNEIIWRIHNDGTYNNK